ncbi:MAG: VWA domain-containing protein [Candidatus Altiarchaeota archaeon]|nr:VWA domain-containing protein [Candidatus Altiarchaeota archaeon]
MKKGYAIVLDSIIALSFSFIVLYGLSGYYKYHSEEVSFKKLHYASEDAFDTLNKNGVLDDIGEAWANSNGTTNSSFWQTAQNISQTYLEMLIPYNMGYRLEVENDIIAESNDSQRPVEGESPTKTNAERLLVGYGKGMPIRGHVSRAFLTGIREKTNTRYLFFGGSVGKGDITVILHDLPGDANVTSACFELNAGDAFTVEINGVPVSNPASFTPSGTGMGPNVNGSNACIASPGPYFTGGDYAIKIIFLGADLEDKYIRGGFLRVEYTTGEADTEEASKVQEDWLPEINGLIDLRSSLYVPGVIDTMDAYLHFKSNYTTFMTIGDALIFETNQTAGYCSINYTTGEYVCTLPDSYLSTKLSYAQIGDKTVPFYISIGNVSSVSYVDIMLVNDISDSMEQAGWQLTAAGNASEVFENITVPDAGWSSLQTFTINASVKRLAASATWGAKDGFNGSESSEVVISLKRPDNSWVIGGYSSTPENVTGIVDPPNDTIGNTNEYYSGVSTKPQAVYIENPLAGAWEVAVYGWDLQPKTGPPADINVNISIYADTDATSDDDINKTDTVIMADAVRSAANAFLQQLAPDDHVGYVEFSTASTPKAALTENKTQIQIQVNQSFIGGGTAIHLGIIDANSELQSVRSRSNVQHIIVLLTDGLNDAGPAIALQRALEAKNNGTKIFTIGLGPFASESLLEGIASRTEYYHAAAGAQDLESAYMDVAGQINSTYRTLLLNESGSSGTILYGDSYIQTRFDPSDVSDYGELSFVYTTNPFGDAATCRGYLFAPSDVVIADAKVTSYSGEHWTDFLSVGDYQPYRLWDDYGNGGGMPYAILGNPFIAYIPVADLESGVNNTIHIETGDGQYTRTGCSGDSRAIYTVRAKMMVDYGDVFQTAEGCEWTMEFEDGTTLTAKIPISYNGTEQCYYTSSNQTASAYDCIDNSIYRLMKHLDFDNNGRVDVLFNPDTVKFEVIQAGGVKSLWGPAKFKLILWM